MSLCTVTILLCFLGYASGLVSSFIGCDSPWLGLGDSCYLFSNKNKTWVDAEVYCRSQNAYLAAIDNQEKMDFINSYANFFYYYGLHYFWIGLSDMVIEGQWRWLKTGQLITYSNWGYSKTYGQEPTNGTDENCVLITKLNGEFKWADSPCSTNPNFICEKK